MLNEEINLILVGDTWHELPYYQREKADFSVEHAPVNGFRISMVHCRCTDRDLQDLIAALECCSRFAPHPAEA